MNFKFNILSKYDIFTDTLENILGLYLPIVRSQKYFLVIESSRK